VAVEGSGRGLLADHDATPRPLKTLASHYAQHAGHARDALILTKTNARSRVHRAGYMDYIGVLSFDDKGRPAREPPAPIPSARGISRWCASALSM